MTSHKSIYLAGPITGLTYSDARFGWREQFADILSNQAPHIECFSPMRQKDFLQGQESLRGDAEALDKLEHALARPHGILTRDFNDVTQRDAMVACFLGAQRVSIGTVWEIGVAYAHKKPLIVVMESPEQIAQEATFAKECFSPTVFCNPGVLQAELEKRGYDMSRCQISNVSRAPDTGDYFMTIGIPGKAIAKTNPHDHVFITHTAGYVVPTLEEAALIASSILTPGV